MFEHPGIPESCRCGSCALDPDKYVLGQGAEGYIAVVGEAPGRDELALGEPFIGMSGELIRETFRAVGVDPDEVYYTNACLCYSNGPPSVVSINACRTRLVEELQRVQPRAILVVGNTAIRAVLPNEAKEGVSKVRGNIVYSEELGTYCIPTLHPAAVLRRPAEFSDFSKDVQKSMIVAENDGPLDQTPPELVLVKTPAQVLKMVQELYRDATRSNGTDGHHIICDIETTGFDPFEDRILRIGIAVRPDRVFIVYSDVLTNRLSLDNLRMIMEDKSIKWSGHNIGMFDAKFLKAQLNIDMYPAFDTMLAYYCCEEDASSYSLKKIAVDMYHASMYKEELTKHKQSGDIRFDELPDDVLDTYLGWDLHYTVRLTSDLVPKMIEEGVQDVHDKILIPASWAFRDIELTGARIDTVYLKELSERLDREINEETAELSQTIGRPNFNPRSYKQVSELLYDQIGFPDPGGRPTGKEVLEQWKDDPIVSAILSIRQKSSTRGTYVDGMLKRVYPDERLRADFKLHGTATGRLSCSNPNLQNIPVLIGPLIRNAFVATTEEGWDMIHVDYSQLELRVAAWYSGDEYLMEAYRTGQDIHRLVASEIFGKPPEEITYHERYIAKYVDFGILYGRGAVSLARDELNCSVQEAQSYIDRFFERFSGVEKWIEEQRATALKEGYVTTPFGRKRRFPLITPNNVAEVEHQAGNTPIQSLASDINLGALTRMHFRFKEIEAREGQPTVRILLTVHDSIILECRKEFRDEALRIVHEEMEENVPLEKRVPFKVEAEIGYRWGSLEEVEFPEGVTQ